MQNDPVSLTNKSQETGEGIYGLNKRHKAILTKCNWGRPLTLVSKKLLKTVKTQLEMWTKIGNLIIQRNIYSFF